MKAHWTNTRFDDVRHPQPAPRFGGDAVGIAQAVQRPNMRFVPVKTEEQQSRLMVHRARQDYVEACTACINRIRGLLSEFGVVLPLRAEVVRREACEHLADHGRSVQAAGVRGSACSATCSLPTGSR